MQRAADRLDVAAGRIRADARTRTEARLDEVFEARQQPLLLRAPGAPGSAGPGADGSAGGAGGGAGGIVVQGDLFSEIVKERVAERTMATAAAALQATSRAVAPAPVPVVSSDSSA